MKVLSLFSGIGAFEKALDNLNQPYELVGYSEIDKYASRSYAAIHGVDESMNLGDITKIDESSLPKDIDLITYGFPCQDISLAGKQKGLFNEDGTQTRSGLFFEALRIIESTKPKVAIAENVKNLTGKKFKPQFELVLKSLEEAGYHNYWKVLNAKDYGVPQNRERVFIVSIRKDVDTGTFEFPQGFPLNVSLRDVLEQDVDEKFYVSDVALKGMMEHKKRNQEKGNGFGFNLKTGDDISPTIRGRYYKDGQECLVKQIGNCMPTATRDNPNQGRIYDDTGLSPALNAMGGGGRQPFIIDDMYKGRDQRQYDQYSPSIRSERQGLKVATGEQRLRIRKLTPKECWRLMGFDDSDFEKAEKVNSNTQLYKQAGNSIVVDVLEALFYQLFDCGV